MQESHHHALDQPEVLSAILGKLTLKELAKLATVCTSWAAECKRRGADLGFDPKLLGEAQYPNAVERRMRFWRNQRVDQNKEHIARLEQELSRPPGERTRHTLAFFYPYKDEERNTSLLNLNINILRMVLYQFSAQIGNLDLYLYMVKHYPREHLNPTKMMQDAAGSGNVKLFLAIKRRHVEVKYDQVMMDAALLSGSLEMVKAISSSHPELQRDLSKAAESGNQDLIKYLESSTKAHTP